MDDEYKEERCLLQLLSESLKRKENPVIMGETELDWKKLMTMAEHHVVLSLLYDILQSQNLSSEDRKRLENVSRRIVRQNYRLLFLSRWVIQLLQEHHIAAVLLKGVTAARYYPVPELRKSGDVDLLVFCGEEMPGVISALENAGCFVKKKQISNHHLVLGTREGIDVEVHTLLAEPFDNDKINRFSRQIMPEMKRHICRENILELELPVLSDGYQAYALLIHMLQHFLREGFGLKLLCDWVVFWNREVEKEEIRSYLNLVRESGIAEFSGMITSLCVHFLGLEGVRPGGIWKEGEEMIYAGGLFCKIMEKQMSWKFMMDIFEAEEFGKSSRDRMLVLRGTGISDYVREFQHQMHLNFPNAGKICLLWPALWAATLVRFLYNNRKIRNTSGIKILKRAGNRSWMIKQLRLFEEYKE